MAIFKPLTPDLSLVFVLAELGYIFDYLHRLGVTNWDNISVYFFKGSQYIRYNIANDAADAGYPKPIAGNWPGLEQETAGEIAWGKRVSTQFKKKVIQIANNLGTSPDRI